MRKISLIKMKKKDFYYLLIKNYFFSDTEINDIDVLNIVL